MKIKVIFTGGTISSEISNNTINVDSSNSAQKLLIDNFQINTDYNDIEFDISQPINVLSENMTISDWNAILNDLRNTNFSDYNGIIIAHGTDTLAYTSNMLSIMLVGINIPVVVVSSNYVLTDEKSNGNDNFLNAVIFIKKKIYTGVYVIYRDDDGISKVYLGSRIKQCANITNKFSSTAGINFGEMKYKKFIPIINQNNPTPISIKSKENFENLLLNKIVSINPCVLIITPYTGLDYNNITPTPMIKAVLHGLYHAGTASTIYDNQYSSSILDFQTRCKEKGIDLFIAPLEALISDNYSTTKEMFSKGINALYDISLEMAYAKLILAYSVEDEKIRNILVNGNLFFESNA